MTTNKHNKTEIDNDDSWQFSLILKSFLHIRENENFVVKADFEKKKEIHLEYYYNNIDDFSSEKEINYLNNFLKVAKCNQKKWFKPLVGIYHATFNYREIICRKNFNFMSRVDIRR